MFKMRREQKDAFRRESVREFEDQAVEHVRVSFVERWRELGEVRVRDVIRLGIRRGRKFGFSTELDICKFIDLMLVFGVDFDERCGWVQEILTAPTPTDPHARMAVLHARALEEEP